MIESSLQFEKLISFGVVELIVLAPKCRWLGNCVHAGIMTVFVGRVKFEQAGGNLAAAYWWQNSIPYRVSLLVVRYEMLLNARRKVAKLLIIVAVRPSEHFGNGGKLLESQMHQRVVLSGRRTERLMSMSLKHITTSAKFNFHASYVKNLFTQITKIILQFENVFLF